MKNVAMARSSRNLLKRLAHRGAMKNVAITGSRIHESCRLCTMKNVAFLPSEPWKPSPLAMRNVALAIDRHEHHEKCRFSSTLNKPPCRSIRGTERIIRPCTTRYGSTMENVALNHEKCRYCPFSSGNQERKESLLKKEQDEEGGSSSNFSSSLERVEAKTNRITAFLLRLQGFKLKLFAFSSAGRYEERAAKLAKPHSLSGLPCSSHGTPSSPPIFASASHPRKKANIGSYPLSLALA